MTRVQLGFAAAAAAIAAFVVACNAPSEPTATADIPVLCSAPEAQMNPDAQARFLELQSGTEAEARGVAALADNPCYEGASEEDQATYLANSIVDQMPSN